MTAMTMRPRGSVKLAVLEALSDCPMTVHGVVGDSLVGRPGSDALAQRSLAYLTLRRLEAKGEVTRIRAFTEGDKMPCDWWGLAAAGKKLLRFLRRKLRAA